MLETNLKELLIENSSEMDKKIQSKQYDLSNKILKKRIQSKLPIKEFANTLDLTVEEYLDYEYCELKYELEDYVLLYEKILFLLYNKSVIY